jgi:hypothetical protein
MSIFAVNKMADKKKSFEKGAEVEERHLVTDPLPPKPPK